MVDFTSQYIISGMMRRHGRQMPIIINSGRRHNICCLSHDFKASSSNSVTYVTFSLVAGSISPTFSKGGRISGTFSRGGIIFTDHLHIKIGGFEYNMIRAAIHSIYIATIDNESTEV